MLNWLKWVFDGMFCRHGRPDRDKIGYWVGLCTLTGTVIWYAYHRVLTEWMFFGYGTLVMGHSLWKKYLENRYPKPTIGTSSGNNLPTRDS